MTMPPLDDALPEALLQAAAEWHFRLRAAPQNEALQVGFDAWLAEDARHADAWLLAQRGWSLAAECDAMAISVLAPPQPEPRRMTRSLAAMALLAACLGLALIWPDFTGFGADYSTGTGQSRDVALSDGSTIVLDASSAVDAAVDAARRNITLRRGEAHFAVTPDAARPFVVRAGDLTVTVTGTAFTVGMTERSYTVAVAEGAVTVRHGMHDAVALSPGERLEIDLKSGAAHIDAIDRAAIAAWRSGRLAVQDAALGDVVSAIRRHHRGVILTPDANLLDHKVTGVFDLRDAPRALQALAGPYGARVVQYSPYLIVLYDINPSPRKN
ncbi:FecR domain-containing protein [Ferrovibrio terrae]|uniref:FecR family protein n=1 Tax=Ferrovibrio terrae TaxID=2594003 RepID=UPI003137BFDD